MLARTHGGSSARTRAVLCVLAGEMPLFPELSVKYLSPAQALLEGKNRAEGSSM